MPIPNRALLGIGRLADASARWSGRRRPTQRIRRPVPALPPIPDKRRGVLGATFRPATETIDAVFDDD
ncbi:hypothetical protein [Gordonia crocea]|uniref:hypothetical protein n=1 Tax=Gordonia crocea TaxID=589162 RepID=UPI00137AD4C2|nr:hypothetical protein [Gordonia crocea]